MQIQYPKIMKKNKLLFITLFVVGFSISCTRYVDTRTTTTSSSSGSGSSSGSSGGSSGTGSGTGSGSTTPAPTPTTGSGTGTGTGGGTTNPAPTPITPPTTGSGGTTSSAITLTNVGIAYTSTSPCAPSNEVFTFASTAKGAPKGTVYTWYFGDNNTVSGTDSTAKNTYAYSNNYNVTLDIFYNNTKLGTKTISIKSVGQDVTPNTSFYSTPQGGTAFYFNSSSNVNHGSIVGQLWNFGDGATSALVQTTHVFPAVAFDKGYNVTLQTTSTAGCTSSVTQVVTVPATYTVAGSITSTSTSPCAPSHEVFTFSANNITGVPSGATYTWDYVDGTGATGATVNHTYTYGNPFNVILVITYNGVQLYKTAATITAFGQDVTPTAAFTVYSKSSVGNYYGFNSSSTINHGSISSFTWDFGDGSAKVIGGTQYIEHTYTQQTTDKNYTISLSVVGSSGCTSSVTNSVVVPHK